MLKTEYDVQGVPLKLSSVTVSSILVEWQAIMALERRRKTMIWKRKASKKANAM